MASPGSVMPGSVLKEFEELYNLEAVAVLVAAAEELQLVDASAPSIALAWTGVLLEEQRLLDWQNNVDKRAGVLDKLQSGCCELAREVSQACEHHWNTQKDYKGMLHAAVRDSALYKAKTVQYKERSDAADEALIRHGFDDELRQEKLVLVSEEACKLMASNAVLKAKLQPLEALPPSIIEAEAKVHNLRKELNRLQVTLNAQLRDL